MAMASSSMDEDMESTPRTGDECLDELNSTAEAEVNGPDMNEANATEEEMTMGSQPQHALALAQVEETEDAVADNVQVGGLAQHQSHGDLTDISPLSEEDADDKEEDRVSARRGNNFRPLYSRHISLSPLKILVSL